MLLALTAIPIASVNAQDDAADNRLARFEPQIDKAIEDGLEWLSQQHNAQRGMPGQHGNTNAVSALTAMAFLASGHTPGNGPYGDVINQCIDYVLDHEGQRNGRPNGVFIHGGERMYGHCIATLLLSEVSGMVDPKRQERIDEALPRALRVILDAQKVKKRDPRHQGGWRYAPNSTDSDMSVSGWALMALRSARINGAAVPDDAIKDAVAYIKRSFHEQSGAFVYQPGQGPRYPLTGAAVVCLELTGHHRSEMTRRAGNYLLSPIRRGRFVDHNHRWYAIYYCSQATFQLGDDYWVPFAERMYEQLLKSQQRNGSWENQGYPTAMAVLALSVPYQQLPIYQR